MKLGMSLFCSSPASTAVRSSPAPNGGRRSFHQRQNPKFFSSVDKHRDGLRRKSCADVSDIRGGSLTGSSSSRYLLSDKDNWVTQNNDDNNYYDRAAALVTVQDRRRVDGTTAEHVISSDESSPILKPSASSARSGAQVVVLRVSIHCKGCEAKVRKHISKMEGVRSFSTDLETKKVTVMGDVTPLGVLNSISKIKNAQFWPSSTPSHHHHHDNHHKHHANYHSQHHLLLKR